MNEIITYALILLEGVDVRGHENIKRMAVAMEKLKELQAALRKEDSHGQVDDAADGRSK